MPKSRIKPLGGGFHTTPYSENLEKVKGKGFPEFGVVPTRIHADLLSRIDDWIQNSGHNSRHRSQWVRDAVVNFYHYAEGQEPLELVGTINMFCPIDEVPGPKVMLRTTYRRSGSHKTVVESSNEFLKALAALEGVLSKAPITKASPRKTRTDIVVAASRYYLRKLRSE